MAGEAAEEGAMAEAEAPPPKRLKVTLDSLHIRRIRSMDEAGHEEIAEEPPPDQKLLGLLSRIDFRQPARPEAPQGERRREEKAAEWPWQAAMEQLQLAQEELRVVLDLVASVESGEHVSILNVGRAKLAPAELVSNLAQQVAVKQRECQSVGKDLKKSAAAMSRHLASSGRFYSGLLSLQKHWKIRRHRPAGGAAAAETAGFTVDLTLPASSDGPIMPTARTAGLLSLALEQDKSEALSTQLPPRQPIRRLQVDLMGVEQGVEGAIITPRKIKKRGSDGNAKQKSETQSGEGDKNNDGGKADCRTEGLEGAHLLLQQVQGALLDEQVFDALEKEVLTPSPALPPVVGMGDSHLDISAGHGCTLRIQLVQEPPSSLRPKHVNPKTSKTVKLKVSNLEAEGVETKVATVPPSVQSTEKIEENGSAEVGTDGEEGEEEVRQPLDVFVRQAYLRSMWGQSGGYWGIVEVGGRGGGGGGRGGEKGGRGAERERRTGGRGGEGGEAVKREGMLRQLLPVAAHRAFRASVMTALEKLVRGIPHLHLRTRLTWQPHMSAWDLFLSLPDLSPGVTQPSRAAGSEKRLFQCTVVVRVNEVSIEAMEGAIPLSDALAGKKSSALNMEEGFPRRTGAITVLQMETLIFHQVAIQMVIAVHQEATFLGLNSTSEMLTVTIKGIENKVELTAGLSLKENLILWSVKGSGEFTGRKVLESGGEQQGNDKGEEPWERVLGVLSWADLRGLLLDLLVGNKGFPTAVTQEKT